MTKKYPLSRRDFITLSGTAAIGLAVLPNLSFSEKAPSPLMRNFGRMKNKVTTLGLGGQASIQWTPEDVDPAAIILKSFELGVNYYDTSNVYEPSQLNYNKAFKKLNLIPGEKNYNKKLRESITLTSKTLMRWGKPGWSEIKDVRNKSNGPDVKSAVEDLKRSMTQIFGDGKGNYPAEAYLDIFLIHSITTFEEVDVVFKGLDTPLNKDENFGALVALRDYRDGTNLTGTNPKNEKLIKHIGFSGHNNPPAMIDMLQRDDYGILDALLVSYNSNDKLYFNMKNNVIPLAKAKGLGIIGMKVFADAALYHKEARFSKTPADVYREVGSASLPSAELIEYVLSNPDIDTLIIGIGNIDKNPLKCQLTQNYYAAQVLPNAMSAADQLKIEAKTAAVKNGRTNFFQLDKVEMTSPREVMHQTINGTTKITWQTAYAAEVPIAYYEIQLDNKVIGKVAHTPQLRKAQPFVFETKESGTRNFKVYSVDEAGKKA